MKSEGFNDRRELIMNSEGFNDQTELIVNCSTAGVSVNSFNPWSSTFSMYLCVKNYEL
jgi:hypothetical protein